MKQSYHLRTALIVALVLPGLAMSAPIAGSCGRCGDGDSCHLARPAEPAPEAGSCCESEPSDRPAETSFGSSSCECGREAPEAVAAPSSTFDGGSSLVPIVDSINPLGQTDAGLTEGSHPPAPPPAPPAYLVDCAFLT